MPSRRIIKSVLGGFLGTYTSRNSDFGGYWLHGQLPLNALSYEIDLLSMPKNGQNPNATAQRLAIRRFREQLTKSGLDIDLVQSAYLKINIKSEMVDGRQGDYWSKGRMVGFVVTVVLDNGHSYERKRSVFVAPHDPEKERQRLPADWGN